MKQKQGIFISYRRSTGSIMARLIFDRLRMEKGYKCFAAAVFSIIKNTAEKEPAAETVQEVRRVS